MSYSVAPPSVLYLPVLLSHVYPYGALLSTSDGVHESHEAQSEPYMTVLDSQ